jgi:hypothetical protein
VLLFLDHHNYNNILPACQEASCGELRSPAVRRLKGTVLTYLIIYQQCSTKKTLLFSKTRVFLIPLNRNCICGFVFFDVEGLGHIEGLEDIEIDDLTATVRNNTVADAFA